MKAPPRRALLGLAAAALAAGAGTAWWRGRTPDDAGVWELRLPRPDGGELALADWRGRKLVLNFWATWCAPCVRELPQLDRFQRDFAAQGWQVLGIAVDRAEAVREFLQRTPLSFPSGLAGLQGTELSRRLGNHSGALPFSVLFDARGDVMRLHLGETSYEQLKTWASRA